MKYIVKIHGVNNYSSALGYFSSNYFGVMLVGCKREFICGIRKQGRFIVKTF